MYIIGWLLVSFPFNAATGRLEAVQIDRFKTQAECVAVIAQAKAKHGDTIAPLGCMPLTRDK